MAQLFDKDLDKCAANYQPLTPLRFLDRAADVFPDRTAVIYNDLRYTWLEYAQRCRRLASALIDSGIERGNTVTFIAANIPAMLEAHFGVPLAGAVLNCINVRLDAVGMAYILGHSETRMLFVDQQFADVAREAVQLSGLHIDVVDILDASLPATEPVGIIEYEAFLASAPRCTALRYPEDEWDAITLNYTSGTTGKPKGAVYHHRGAYINSLGTTIYSGLNHGIPTYLWTLPLFHCNGWCHAWALAIAGGTSVCLRKVAAEDIYTAIEKHKVTYLCGAPTVLGFLISGKPANWKMPARPITIACAGASPPAAILQQTLELGFNVMHVYGMTEQHSVNTVCVPQESWETLSPVERLSRMGRQGVRTAVADEMIVADPRSLVPVPWDGHTMGEILFRSNIAMKGYLKNPDATKEAFADGWHHSGDLAVVHEDGYIEIKDRSKDIIISGGENVSSIEVEDVLYAHPAIEKVAVVAVPDERWGEVPCAVVELKPGYHGKLTEQDIIAFCRQHLPGFKTPKHIIFEPITFSATGKLQKFKLRQHAAHVIGDRTAST
ncbi:AMP-binding protein [Achromobacter insolitus]|uniref:3-methylmercaptopropionyl-CoA ligase n=1 Tax=Achromobacter insolitus TaxID=217204 RepID=A0A6S7EVT7_9BURK|nr:AMP-binding protein [Achromobacter insolitus]CAB3929455.1 3-methylmercaptopropionyl-CoA ligase [Achromobacter insolitus]CAB3935788.1 3-methylmercaptopropionyl-CoA ligase [Achromobacter insolitus]